MQALFKTMENDSTLFLFFMISIMSLFATIIFYTIHHYYFPRSRRNINYLPPGPLSLPIFGCLFQMLRNRPTFRWIHKLMDQMNTEIACFRLGQVHIICVTSPELAREFLKQQDSVFASRPDCMSGRMTSHRYLGAILSPYGDQWKKMRRIISSELLSSAMHTRLHGKRTEEADHLVRYIYKQCENSNGLVNVRVAARHYCGNVVRKLVFGKRFFGKGTEDGGPGMEEKEHVAALFTILHHLYGFGIADYFSWLEVFDFDGYKKILKDALDRVTKYHDIEINKRVQAWKDGRRKKEEDMLDVLINLRDSNDSPLLSIQEIKAQVIEIMIATVDNPSNAIEWAMAEMLNQPNIFLRAQKELDQVVGRDRLVQESDLSRLNFVKACVKEAFRLHPIVPFNVPHVSVKDTTVAGYFIPKDSHVLLSRHGLGRNPRVWEDALMYKPERHLLETPSEVVLVDNDLRMLSFSTGRRGCPGVLLGSTMATMLLARLVQGFSWTTPQGASLLLVESKYSLFLAKPLIAHARPRLNETACVQFQE